MLIFDLLKTIHTHTHVHHLPNCHISHSQFNTLVGAIHNFDFCHMWKLKFMKEFLKWYHDESMFHEHCFNRILPSNYMNRNACIGSLCFKVIALGWLYMRKTGYMSNFVLLITAIYPASATRFKVEANHFL